MSVAKRWRRTTEDEVNNERPRHSEELRRFEQWQGMSGLDTRLEETPLNEKGAASETEEAFQPAASGVTRPAYRIVVRNKTTLIVEQTVEYHPGRGGPVLSAEVRLTTAVRGKRKQDGVSLAAYLLRLEVLRLSPGLRVAGISLGPWQASEVELERGSILEPDLIWSAFQPGHGPARGRLLLDDSAQNRVLDLPWRTEGILPGSEPFSG